MPYVFGVAGIWYSKPLMDKYGWAYPQHWDEMLTLCEEIKKAGIARTYQGKFPGYLTSPMLMTAYKAAGPDLKKKVTQGYHSDFSGLLAGLTISILPV
jgi:N-acetylglucosamine transport system substrate-binding protein